MTHASWGRGKRTDGRFDGRGARPWFTIIFRRDAPMMVDSEDSGDEQPGECGSGARGCVRFMVCEGRFRVQKYA